MKKIEFLGYNQSFAEFSDITSNRVSLNISRFLSKNHKNTDETGGLLTTKIPLLNTEHHPISQNTPTTQAKIIGKVVDFLEGGAGQI